MLGGGRARHSVRAVECLCGGQGTARPTQKQVTTGHSGDRPTPNLPRVRTTLCEQDSSKCSWFSPPTHDGRADDDQRSHVANPHRFSSHIFLPIFNHRFHSWFAPEHDDGMQMIRHEETQPTMPDEFIVVVFHCGQHGITGSGLA